MKYTCYRCFYSTDKKSSFINHANRKSICKRTQESYKYSELELVSLVDNQLENKDITFNCKLCNKIFLEKYNLNKHIKTHNINNSIIGDNNIIQNINININTPIPFDKDWDLSQISELNIYKLLFSKFMYSKLLEEILKNEINLNVIIENESDSGLVYKNDNDKYVNMNIKDITEKSIIKLNKHLLDLNNHLDTVILEDHLKNIKTIIDNKFNDYINNNNNIKDGVNRVIKDRYLLNNKDAILLCNKIADNNIIEY